MTKSLLTSPLNCFSVIHLLAQVTEAIAGQKLSISVCLCVNQGGANHNRYRYRPAILYEVPDISPPPNFHPDIRPPYNYPTDISLPGNSSRAFSPPHFVSRPSEFHKLLVFSSCVQFSCLMFYIATFHPPSGVRRLCRL